MIIEKYNREQVKYMESVREKAYSRMRELAQARAGIIPEPIVHPIEDKADVVSTDAPSMKEESTPDA